jgi:Spy/CpxP family protein refolding chaperone
MIGAHSHNPGGITMDTKLNRILATATATALLALAAAPAIAQGPPGGGPPPGMGMRGMGGPVDRAGMIQRLALDDPALKLSAAQKAQVDKLVDGYIAEQAQLREKYPMTQGTPPSQEMMTAMRGSRDNLNTAVGKVLDDSQRATWEAAMAARRPPGMGGPPGGPPPAR